jgi:hypothetical protein
MAVPTIAIDYLFLGGKGEKEGEGVEGGMPTLTARDDKTGMILSAVVPEKGRCAYAIRKLTDWIEQLGYKKIIIKSDSENSITALKKAVKAESTLEMILEETPVGDHAANGAIESTIKQVQGQFRTMKSALETRLNMKIKGDHDAVPWLMMHAGAVMNRRRKDAGGLTAYRKWKGKEFDKHVAEFGERVMYLKSDSAGKDKFNSRWEEGAYLGLRDESGESIIGTKEGVIKGKDFRRMTEGKDRWNKDTFNSFNGVPWEPIPGQPGQVELNQS